MKRLKFLLLATVIVVASGCEDFLDINRDPNNPSEPNIQQLLPGIQSTVGSIFSYDFGAVGYAASAFTHQLSTRQPEYDNYGITGSSFAVTYWTSFYAGALQDVELIISLGEETGNTYYAGIGKVLKAYLYSTMVDLWGDIPFSEANVPGIASPVFDDDEAIYGSCLDLLDAAVIDFADEEAENLVTPGDDDLIYNGDVDSWIAAANTIKLKLMVQVQDVDLYDQTEVDALLDGTLISSWGESFNIPYGPSSTPDDRHPAFVAEYGGGQISNYISPWLYEIMQGVNPDILTGVTDPRVPYYFVNQITDGTTENPPEYQDGNFVSIYFGSTGLNRDHAGRATFTMMGIYPCGGKYDDGTGRSSGGGLTTTDGTGVVPQRLVTYADRLYLEAELIAQGKATGDLRAVLESAIYESLKQVDFVVDGSGTTQTVPAISGSGADTAYVDGVLAEFDAGDADRQLEIVMTQKWISSFGTSHDQYTDYRRTGYPVMFDPEDPSMAPGGFVSGGPDGTGPVPVQRTRAYPLSWPYYNDELTLNSNAPEQKTIATDGVFWDK
ncbi:MAG: SusD/RagB family nutrient-binding outer membrane lipoprotein [Bacteroidales bacterium]